MSYQKTNSITPQSIEQECAHFSPTNLDQTDSFSATFEQRKYLHDVHNLEQRTLWNSSSSGCFQPSDVHGRHGEPLYRSLLRSHYHTQPSCLDYVEGAHHLRHKQCLCEADNSVAGNCFTQQCAHHNTCRCGPPMLHETNTRNGLLSKGHGYHPNIVLSNEVTLYNWYLIRSGDPHSSDIAVGGFLSRRGTEAERIETVTIVKRLTERKLLTKDGNVINLMGPIDDYKTVSNGFTLQMVHLFMSGFPHIWNLVVGMGLPAKATGTIISSRTCGVHGGEINFHERLDKQARNQSEYIQLFPSSEGLETDLASSLDDGERSCRDTHLAGDSICEEADPKLPESAAVLEQGMSLQDAVCNSKGDQQLLHNQDQQRALSKTEEKEGTCTEECSQLEGFHCQIKSTANKRVELTKLAFEQGNIHTVTADAPVSDIGNKESELTTEKTTENGTKEEYQVSQAFFDSTPDASAEAYIIPGDDKLELASVHSFQMSEGELQMAQSNITACKARPKRRNVAFSTANHVEGGDPSNVSPSLEASTKGMGTSCSLLSKQEGEHKSSIVSIETRKGVVSKKVTAKKKAKRKRRGGSVLIKSKRSTKPMADVKKRANSVKQQRDPSHKRELIGEVKKNESRMLMKGQVEQDLSTDKTAEAILDSVLLTRMKTRQGMKTREGPIKSLGVKKCVQTKSVGKDCDCSTKLKDSDNQAPTLIPPCVSAHLEDHDSLPSGNSRRKEKRRRSRGSVMDLQLDTPEQKEANKPSENLETLVIKNLSFALESSKQSCSEQTHDGCDPSSTSSMRKKIKMLPPPLPSPLVSVPKQLVSKAFGLKTSKSGRLLVPPLAHWRGQSLVRDMDGGIIAIEDGSQGAPRETGCFNFKPPMEARAKKLQEWLSMTASKCLTKKVNARRKSRQSKTAAK